MKSGATSSRRPTGGVSVDETFQEEIICTITRRLRCPPLYSSLLINGNLLMVLLLVLVLLLRRLVTTCVCRLTSRSETVIPDKRNIFLL